MEQKIKIYVSQKTASILCQDAELFEFYKADRTVNRNAFLNALIVSDFERYRAARDTLRERVESLLESSGTEKSRAGELASAILQIDPADSDEKHDTALSLKPNRDSSGLIAYIESVHLHGQTLSAYFRSMFEDYISMPRNEREKIIFKDTYEQLDAAIRRKRIISFSLKKHPGRIYTVIPYALTSSREELFNYLIGTENGRPMSFRLSRIGRIITGNTCSPFSEDMKKTLDLIIACGPQYAIRVPRKIIVELTETGIRRYEAMYLHRPPYTERNGSRFAFLASPVQILQYFSRFGKDALIIEPKSLREEMKEYYQEALDAYE